jgi:hypothetical protein
VAKSTNAGDQMTQKRTMLGTVISAVEPAEICISALVIKLITWSSHQNNLGTNNPSEAVIGIDDLNRYLYMIPVVPGTFGATRITYRDTQAYINLYETFMKLDRLVHPGIREYYTARPTPGQVTVRHTTTDISGKVTVQEIVKGWGIYIDLHDVTKEPIHYLSDEEKASRAAKRAQTLAAKKQNT